MIRGQVLYVDGQEVWLADGNRLFTSGDGGETWQVRGVLPRKRPRDYLSVNRLGQRLARLGFHHLGKIGIDGVVVIANQSVWSVRQEGGRLQELARVVGSRPLAIEADERSIYFGEYRANYERAPVHLWRVDSVSGETEPLVQFSQIRHIHGVFFDEYSNGYWITTGDYDHESFFWWINYELDDIKRVVGGNQQYRVVQPIFTEEYIYFGSDAPDSVNYIYRMSRETLKVEALANVGDPVFYGCKVGRSLFFSTVVENRKADGCGYAGIWGASDGRSWRCIYKFEKDWLSLRYFQYGQVRFPRGPGDGANLWFTPVGTEGDGYTFKIDLVDLNV